MCLWDQYLPLRHSVICINVLLACCLPTLCLPLHRVIHKVLPYHPTSRHRSYTGVLDQTFDSAVEAQDYGKHSAPDGYHATRDHLRWGLPVTKVCTGVCKSGVCELSAEEIKHCTSGYA